VRRRFAKPIVLGLLSAALLTPASAEAYAPPPADAGFDYQIGGA